MCGVAGAIAGAECVECHHEYAARMRNSLMHLRDIDGQRVTDCRDCHVSHDAAVDECSSTVLVPIERCFGCHFDPRPLPINPMGVINTHYGGEKYEQSGGLLCQDCHTSSEIHGGDAPVSQLEVRCEDCHGSVDVGPRHRNGLVLTSRGVPLGNVSTTADGVVLRSAGGGQFSVPVLRTIRDRNSWKNATARQAMLDVRAHRERMECTTCHADWAQPCYGCHAENGGSH
jgi:hypothetical protein